MRQGYLPEKGRLCHTGIKMADDCYVHVTDASVSKAVLKFEKTQQNQKMVQ